METSKQTVIAALLERMDKSPGFAGLGESVQTISRLDEDADPRLITAAILHDAALTGKLLRIANSSQRSGRNVSTVDQAIVILGLNTVKSVALSLSMLSSLSSQPQSKQLHAEIVAAYFCGMLSFEITRLYAPRFNAQEAQVCGLMQNLGRMMTTYYQYEQVEQVRAIQAEKNITEEEAVQQVFGMGFDVIGAAIAQHWSLPDVLQKSLSAEIGKVPPRAASDTITWHQLCAVFARRVTDTLFRFPENVEKIELSRHLDFFRTALSLKETETREVIERALEDTNNLLTDIGFPCNVEQARNLLHKASERVLDRLSSSDSLTRGPKDEGKKPIEIIQTVLRHIHDALGFDRTLILLPQGASGLLAIAGVGRNAGQVVTKFRCLGAKPDVFRIVMSKKIDVFISDIHQPAYAKLLPEWYTEAIDAKSIQLLSLLHEGQFIGMVYGDYTELHTAQPPILTEDRMNEWRHQLVRALLSGSAKH